MTNEEFFKTLSNDEWDEADGIAWIGSLLCGDLTKDAEILFVRAAVERKRANPDAKAGEQLNAGLAALGKPPLKTKQKRKGKLAGAGV